VPNKRVFICSPFRGATPEEQAANVEMARALLAHAVRNCRAPFAPHLLYPGALNDNIESERNQGIDAGLNFLLTCDEIWWLDSHKGVTAGMRRELELASVAGLGVYRAGRVRPEVPLVEDVRFFLVPDYADTWRFC
jgi:hypothetical protein